MSNASQQAEQPAVNKYWSLRHPGPHFGSATVRLVARDRIRFMAANSALPRRPRHLCWTLLLTTTDAWLGQTFRAYGRIYIIRLEDFCTSSSSACFDPVAHCLSWEPKEAMHAGIEWANACGLAAPNIFHTGRVFMLCLHPTGHWVQHHNHESLTMVQELKGEPNALWYNKPITVQPSKSWHLFWCRWMVSETMVIQKDDCWSLQHDK